MKRTWILTLALLLLLSGCAQADQPPETTAPVEEPDPNALDAIWLHDLEVAFSREPFRGMPRNFYNGAPNMYFEAPEKIDLYRFLCYGTGRAQDHKLTAQELEDLKAYPGITSAMENTDTFVYRYEKQTVRELLDTCFQVTLEAVDSADPNLVYLESTDCYYVVWHMAGPGGLEVLEGTYLSRGEGGQELRFTYRDIWEGDDVCYEAVVSTESGLYVLSNRIVEE